MRDNQPGCTEDDGALLVLATTSTPQQTTTGCLFRVCVCLPIDYKAKHSMSGALAVGAVAGAFVSSAARRLSSQSSFADNNSNNATTATSSAATEKNVGILAVEVYTPSTFIKQSALEEHSGVPAGKYTIGLGQDGLAVTGDAEDVNSLCLTVVHSLLEK